MLRNKKAHRKDYKWVVIYFFIYGTSLTALTTKDTLSHTSAIFII